ncbi:YfhO family protein [Thermodesulfobacteriota bacterium]
MVQTHHYSRLSARTVLAVLFILCVSLLFFYPVLLQHKTFYAFDTLLQDFPWAHFVPGFRAHNPLITDPVNMGYIFHQFFKTSIAQGTLPLWNGSNLCGVPFASGFTTQGNPVVFFALILLPLSVAHDFILWFHLFGAGCFMFLYLRRLGLGASSAVLGAVSWMFNGYVMVWFEFENTPILAFSLPASLYYAELWLSTRATRHCLLFTSAVAIGIASGYAHLILYQMLFVGIYLVYRYVGCMRGPRTAETNAGKELFQLFLALFLGICISSHFVSTYLSFLDDPQRTTFSVSELFNRTGQLHPKYLTTLVFPDFFGSPVRNVVFTPRSTTQVYNNYNELCIYGGVFNLFLALACIPCLLKRRDILFYTLAGLTTLTMAMGSFLYYPLAKWFPGLGFSAPTRVLYIFGFCYSTLAAMGMDVLRDISKGTRSVLAFVWLSIALASFGACAFVQTGDGIRWAASTVASFEAEGVFEVLREYFRLSSPAMSTPLALVSSSLILLGLVLFSRTRARQATFMLMSIGLVAFDLMTFGLSYNTAAPRHWAFPSTEAIRFLQKDTSLYRIVWYGGFMHNSFAPFSVSDIGGYHSFYPKRYGEYLHLSQYGADTPFPEHFSRWVSFERFGSPLLDLINTKYVLLPPNSSVQMSKLRLVYNKEIRIYENEDVFPRAFFVSGHHVCTTRHEARTTLARWTGDDFRTRVLLESSPAEAFKPSIEQTSHDGNPDAEVKVTSYTSNRIEVTVSSPRPGLLVLSDTYHRGWKARVDGEEASVLRANYIMRAVALNAGQHTVVLDFHPIVLSLGMFVTAAGWMILAGLLFASFFRSRKRHS